MPAWPLKSLVTLLVKQEIKEIPLQATFRSGKLVEKKGHYFRSIELFEPICPTKLIRALVKWKRNKKWLLASLLAQDYEGHKFCILKLFQPFLKLCIVSISAEWCGQFSLMNLFLIDIDAAKQLANFSRSWASRGKSCNQPWSIILTIQRMW